MRSCWGHGGGAAELRGPGVTLEEMVGAAQLGISAAWRRGSSYPWEPQESTQHTTVLLTSY